MLGGAEGQLIAGAAYDVVAISAATALWDPLDRSVVRAVPGGGPREPPLTRGGERRVPFMSPTFPPKEMRDENIRD
jgi:hypothetical protein